MTVLMAVLWVLAGMSTVAVIFLAVYSLLAIIWERHDRRAFQRTRWWKDGAS